MTARTTAREGIVDRDGVVDREGLFGEAGFAAELRGIYAKTWLFLAHESEIPEVGDYVTRRMGKDPVIVVRDDYGDVRAFLNTCPHRGAALCRGTNGHTSAFRCSYHGWTFDTSGDLVGLPAEGIAYGGRFDRADNGLFAVPRIETRHGLIFGSLAPDGPTLVEHLGAMDYYLAAMLGRAANGYESYGPPIRARNKANWKVGAENYVGDGYHILTTHYAAIAMGMLGDSDEELMKSVGGRPTLRENVSYNVVDGGHGLRIFGRPIDFDQPQFLGYPENLQREFTERLDPGQTELLSGITAIHGTIFPNLSFLESVIFEPGKPPVAETHFRQWQPISHAETEILMWTFVPRDAPDDWKAHSHVANLRSLGPAGVFEIDDYYNWAGMQAANEGPAARQHGLNYESGADVQLVIHPHWPGQVYPTNFSEVNQRAFHRHISAVLEGQA